MNRFFIIAAILSITSCGSTNLFDCNGGYAKSSCTKKSKDDDARLALDQNDLDTAVTLLTDLVASEPTNYQRYPLLAAAYAGKSGFDILNVVTADFGGSSSLLQTMSSFLPTPVTRGSKYDQSLSDMNSSVTILKSIPADQRLSTSSDKYSSSAALQLTLYQAAYGVMLISKYTYSTTTYDTSKLSTMTASDALAILDAFGGAAGDSSAGSAATAAIAAIRAEPGSTDQEKIAAWAKTAK